MRKRPEFTKTTIFVTCAMFMISPLNAVAVENKEMGKGAEKPVQCLEIDYRLPQKDVDAFLAQPDALLGKNPAGGLMMANSVRALSGSSQQAFDAVLGLVPKANKSQKAAIGAGLARIVKSCGDVDQALAGEMQKKIAGLADRELALAFIAASDDLKVAALQQIATPRVGGGGSAGDPGTIRGATNYYRYGGDEVFEQQGELNGFHGNKFSVGGGGNAHTKVTSSVTND